MRDKLFLLTVLIAALFSACENIFEDTIADKNSAEAEAEDLELALRGRNYDALIKGLGFDPEAAPAQAKVEALNTRGKYLLQMALLGKTGFSAVDVLDSFMKEDSDDSTSDILLQSFSSGDKSASIDVLDFKQARYKWTKDIGRAGAGGDKNIKTAAGIAATLDTLMSVARVANALAGTAVSFNKDDPNYIGKTIGDQPDKDAVKAKISSSGVDLAAIGENIELLEDTMTSLVPDGDTEMYDKFNEFIETFKDPATGVISVTDDTLAQFIYDQWN
jgi:hypothetical protein